MIAAKSASSPILCALRVALGLAHSMCSSSRHNTCAAGLHWVLPAPVQCLSVCVYEHVCSCFSSLEHLTLAGSLQNPLQTGTTGLLRIVTGPLRPGSGLFIAVDTVELDSDSEDEIVLGSFATPRRSSLKGLTRVEIQARNSEKKKAQLAEAKEKKRKLKALQKRTGRSRLRRRRN